MSENSVESQVPSESAIDLSTTHIILLGLGGVFGLLLGVAVLALAYHCHRKNKLKDKEKGDQVTVFSCDESVGAATLSKNIGTAGTVVLDMDQITTSCQHGHSPMIDDMNTLRQNRASSTKSPVDFTPNNPNDLSTNSHVDSISNNHIDSSLNNPIDSPSVDSPPNSLVDSPSNNPVYSFPYNFVDSPPNNSVHSLPNTPVDSTPNNSVDSPPNNSVDSLPVTPVDSPTNNSVNSFPNTPVDSTPNNSVDSHPNTPVDSPPNTPVNSPPNNSVDSLPITPVDSTPNNSVDSPPNTPIDSPLNSPPNNSLDSLSITPVDSPPNNSVDSLPITPVDSPQNNSVDSSINTHLDSPQNNSVESPGDLSHPEAISPNISNQTSTESPNTGDLGQQKEVSASLSPLTPPRMASAGRPQTVSPYNFEDVEAKEMPEPSVVLPNREACQEGYMSVTKDEATLCKEEGYIRELKGDGDLICQDTMTKNNLIVKDTEKEMNVLSELQILQEKVRALEQQNAVLIKAQNPSEIHSDEKNKTFRDKDAHSRSLNGGLNLSFKTEDMKLIDVDSLEREGGTWLMTVNRGQVKDGLEIPVDELKGNTPICGSPMEGLEWLRRESGVSEDLSASRNTLVDRLNGLANAFMLPAGIQGDGPPLKQTNDVYNSQDMLHDHSHASQAADLGRSMPNLNKTNKSRGAARPQYSLSQNQKHNSETRLQRPSHLQAAESQRVHRGTMGAPTCTLNSRGRPAPGGGKLQSGLRPSSEGLARKSSLPARPSGTSRTSSNKLPSSNGPSGTSRSSSTKLPSSNGPSGTSRSSSTKLPTGSRPSSNGPGGTSSSSSTRLPSGTRPSSTGLAAPSARRGLGRGNIGGTRVS